MTNQRSESVGDQNVHGVAEMRVPENVMTAQLSRIVHP